MNVTRLSLVSTAPTADSPPVPNAVLIDKFLSHVSYRGRSPATVKRRRVTLGQLSRFAGPVHLAGLDVDDLERFLSLWPHPATRRAYRSDVRDFYRWAYRREVVDSDPADELAPVAAGLPEPSPLPHPVLVALFATPNPTTRRMIMVAAYAGLRVAEIARLDASDINIEAATLRVGLSKGGHGRTVRLVPELAAELTGLAPGPVFPHATADSVSHRIKRRLVAAGMPEAHPHHLRHTFATTVARRLGGDIVATAALLGHRSYSTTRRYVQAWQPSAEELRDLYGVAA